MRRAARRLLPTLVATAALAAPGQAWSALEDCAGDLTPSNPENTIVELALGGIGSLCVELLEDQAPENAAAFLAAVQAGDVAGTFIDQLVPGLHVRAGIFYVDEGVYHWNDESSPAASEPCTLDEPVDPEQPEGAMQCSERGNVAGTLAHFDGNPATAWSLNLDDNRGKPDFAYDSRGRSVFGRLLGDGLQLVQDEVVTLPTYPSEQIYYSLIAEPRWTVVGLRQTALLQIPVESPGDYGCFDVDDLAAVFKNVPAGGAGNQSEPDLIVEGVLGTNGQPFLRTMLVSAACGTPLADEADYVPSPPANTDDCPTLVDNELELNDRLVRGRVVDYIQTQFFADESGQGIPGHEASYTFTCAQVEESLFQAEVRRADMGTLIAAQLVVVEQATVVPEPGLDALALAAFATLGGLAHQRRAQ